ncbi:hypothetical protein A2U01_0061364, partial [Trifolium medium]|nr:hypothetical protein [Trifolium medium]
MVTNVIQNVWCLNIAQDALESKHVFYARTLILGWILIRSVEGGAKFLLGVDRGDEILQYPE